MKRKIYQEIKDRILFLEYEPGKALREKELAKEFRVSRTPVREAFLKLEWERLVEIIPRGGVFVTKIEFQSLRNIFHVRVYIEGLMARLAASNITDIHLDEMRRLKKDYENIKNSGDPIKLIKIDIRLREIIHQIVDSRDLVELSDYLYCRTLRIWYSVFSKSGFHREVERQIQEINNTLYLFSKRDPKKAEEYNRKIMREHIERIKIYFSLN